MPDQPRQDPPQLAKTEGYRKEDWNGHDLYQCNDCIWDCTDDENLMREHQMTVHHR